MALSLLIDSLLRDPLNAEHQVSTVGVPPTPLYSKGKVRLSKGAAFLDALSALGMLLCVFFSGQHGFPALSLPQKCMISLAASLTVVVLARKIFTKPQHTQIRFGP